MILVDRARRIAARAHAPYSGCRVGCSILSASGSCYDGCNVENASYGLTVCAERNAIAAAVASEGSSLRIRRVAVTVIGADSAFPPCGACRQVIAEFAESPEIEIAWEEPRGALRIVRLRDLLPFAFELKPAAQNRVD
jgi:cytidine deaminase